MISQDEQSAKPKEQPDRNSSVASKEDLFGYGVAAKISGVEGRGTGEFALIVEGIARIRIDKYTQERPFFEAEVTYLYDDAISAEDVAIQGLFAHLKQLSRELLTLMRLSSILPRSSGSPSLSPIIARRLELYIARKGIQDAGVLADFMVNIVGASFDEKLQVLAALDVKDRLEKSIELLQRQVDDIKNNVSITTITSTSIPSNIDLDQMNRVNNERARRHPSVSGMPFPAGLGGPSEDEQEPNEMDELKKKLDAAKLTPEAAKVADRELKRLKKNVTSSSGVSSHSKLFGEFERNPMECHDPGSIGS